MKPLQNKAGDITCYRHSAVATRFRRFEGEWFLELNPTYHFTRDGKIESRFAADNASKMKQLEHNSAILGQVRMWSEYFSSLSTLFDAQRHLSFGSLLTLNITAGIDDSLWSGRAERDDSNPTEQLSLVAR